MRSRTDSAGTSRSSERKVELSFLNSVAADFYRLLHLDQNLEEKPIDIQVTSDGLRITLFDRSKQPLFKDDGVEMTDWGVHLMQSMAWLIDRHHFRVTIDGHTREGLVLPRGDYSAWELSSDRANAARRKLVYYAVEPGLIERVTGYAATRPLPMEDPKSESNQRITLSLALGTGNRDKEKAKALAKQIAAKPLPVSKAPKEEPRFQLPQPPPEVVKTKPVAGEGRASPSGRAATGSRSRTGQAGRTACRQNLLPPTPADHETLSLR
ncbi:MAG: flagellar motor protein MotB [Lacunisphaera sp.]